MGELVPFEARTRSVPTSPLTDLAELQVYGRAAGVTVGLAKADEGGLPLAVVVYHGTGLKVLASLRDDAGGRLQADLLGRVALLSLRFAEGTATTGGAA